MQAQTLDLDLDLVDPYLTCRLDRILTQVAFIVHQPNDVGSAQEFIHFKAI